MIGKAKSDLASRPRCIVSRVALKRTQGYSHHHYFCTIGIEITTCAWYRLSILGLTYAAYTCYHLSRKPISVVKNVLNQNCSDFVVPPNIHFDNVTNRENWCDWAPFDGSDSSTLLGAIDSAYLFSYAVSMFLSGFVAERVNLRYFLAIGMITSGIFSYAFGIAKSYGIHYIWYFILVQILSGIVQSTGWPGVVTVVGNWFGKKKRGFIFGVWNSHTSMGNILGSLIAGYYVEIDWSLSFIVPGILIAGVGFMIFLFLAVKPTDVGCTTPEQQYLYIYEVWQLNNEKTHLLSRSRMVGGWYWNDVDLDPSREATFRFVFLRAKLVIADMVNTNKETVRQNLHDELRMSKVCAQLVPKNFSQEQKDNRKEICSDIMDRLTEEPYLLTKDITCDFFNFRIFKETMITSLRQNITFLNRGSTGDGYHTWKHGIHRGNQELTHRPHREDSPIIPSHVVEERAIGFFGALKIPGVIEFSLSLFFAKLVSYTFLYWLPLYIKASSKSETATSSAEMSAWFDVGGIFGAIVAGLVSDYYGAAVGPLLAGVVSTAGWQYVFYMLMVADVLALLLLCRLVKREIQTSRLGRMLSRN
ncbi:hypothetical protein C0J52_06997 [Blattella germanica]|nr:hypothetical protein C0J52_06997 [Blattella germanica]